MLVERASVLLVRARGQPAQAARQHHVDVAAGARRRRRDDRRARGRPAARRGRRRRRPTGTSPCRCRGRLRGCAVLRAGSARAAAPAGRRSAPGSSGAPARQRRVEPPRQQSGSRARAGPGGAMKRASRPSVRRRPPRSRPTARAAAASAVSRAVPRRKRSRRRHAPPAADRAAASGALRSRGSPRRANSSATSASWALCARPMRSVRSSASSMSRGVSVSSARSKPGIDVGFERELVQQRQAERVDGADGDVAEPAAQRLPGRRPASCPDLAMPRRARP